MGYVVQKFFLLLGVIVRIPFFTLFERKVLGLIQNRKGPNKKRALGLLQPIFDGIKLIIKESSYLYFSKYLIFSLCSFFSFIIMIFLWVSSRFFKSFFIIKLKIILLLILSSLNVYSLIGSG